jgi:1-acyl-sn-glycerol-3-phosphate acyltransferase
MAWFWGALVYPLAALSTIFCGTVSIVLSLFGRKSERKQIAVARFWSRTLLFFGHVKVHVEGLEKIDPEGHYVFASNHLSYVDTPAIFANIPVQFRFLAKEELFKIPFMGWHLTTAGHVPVPRDDPRGGLKALGRAAELIQTHNISVLFFPEGGRSEDGHLKEFKDGAAYIAIKAQAPLVPLALIGTREVLPMHSALLRRGDVTLRVGDPIETTGMTIRERVALSEAAREQVVALLQRPVATLVSGR